MQSGLGDNIAQAQIEEVKVQEEGVQKKYEPKVQEEGVQYVWT